MMIYLRAATEAALKSALPFAVIGGEWLCYSHNWALVLGGRVELTPSVRGPAPDFVEITPATYDERFHANLTFLGNFTADVSAVEIAAPTSPVPSWRLFTTGE